MVRVSRKKTRLKKNKTIRKGGDKRKKMTTQPSNYTTMSSRKKSKGLQIVIQLSDPDMYFMMLNMIGHDPIHDFSGDRPHSVIKAVNDLTIGQNIQKGGGNNDYLNDNDYEQIYDTNDVYETIYSFDTIFQDDQLLKQIENLIPEITIIKRSEDAPIAWRTRSNLSKLQLIIEYIREFILKLCGYYYDNETTTGGRITQPDNILVKQIDNRKDTFKPTLSKSKTSNLHRALVVEEADSLSAISQKIGKLAFSRYLKNIQEQELSVENYDFMKELISFTYELYNILCSLDIYKSKSFFHIIDTHIVYSGLLLYILRDERKFPKSKYDLIIKIINAKYPDPEPMPLLSEVINTPDKLSRRISSISPMKPLNIERLFNPFQDESMKKQYGGDLTTENISELIETLENKQELNTDITVLKPTTIDQYNKYIKKLREAKRKPHQKIIDEGEQVINDIKLILLVTLEKMNKTPTAEDKSLTAHEKKTKNYVLKYIALGALNFINAATNASIESSSNIDLIGFEIKRLKNISKEGKNISNYDKNLFDEFEKIVKNRNNIITQSKTLLNDYKKKSVVINNGVQNLHKDMNVICPYSSMADAQEAFGSCNSVDIETGDMNCIIQNEDVSSYYNAITKLNTKKVKSKELKFLEMVTQTIFTEGKVMESKSVVDVTSPHVVKLSNNIIKSIINKNNNESVNTLSVKASYLNIMKLLKEKFSQGNPWESFENINHYIDLIRVASRKGNGDIYQELNSVAENGGYIDTIIPNNKIRIGLSNDQPSGVRSGFLILNALSGINENAMAGYYGQQKTLVVRNDEIKR